MGEHNEKMNHQTPELSKKAMQRNVSSLKIVFPAPRSSSSHPHMLQSQSHSVGSGSNAVMRSTGQTSPDKSTSCLPAGCRCRTPLPFAQHQQALSSKTTNLKPDNSGLVENMLSEAMAQNAMEDNNKTESIEEGEFILHKSPDASVKSSMIVHDVIWSGNEKKSVLQGQSHPDGSKSNMKNMTRDSLSRKCLLTRRDFPPGCGSRGPCLSPTEHQDELLCFIATGLKKDAPSLPDIRVLEDLKEAEFIPKKSPDASIKSSVTAHVFKWRGNNDHDDLQGVGAKEAGSQPQIKFQTSSKSTLKKACLREENILYHHCDESNRDVRDMIKEAKKSVQCPPGASPIMKDQGCKRKSLDKRSIKKSLEGSAPDSSESLQVGPRSDIGRASTSFSELRNANVMRNNMHNLARDKMTEALRLYRDICRKLSLEKSKAGKKSTCIRRIDFHAAKEVKKRVGYVHGAKQFIGAVPGVEVGDKFHYRMELAVVGLHRPPQNGIDYMGSHPDILATSVVASWDYTDNLSNPDELVYLGQGGMPGRDKEAEDQKLTRGNLALVNSMKRNKPVRVIRKDRDHTFTYDGLYVVNSYRKLHRENRQMVFKFLMKRLPDQPEIGRKKKMKVLEPS
ncbi:histone-lysine N-methyltransferase, H3 lysine-9 specific SUVH6-like [Rhodamnia argentea]|uniref:Histone-lysine N-methyltransferase, H3 lysine-9 specific SUVH6-like n=1 Tax=Rhodamnia argentea TaxID=178133 RepID=A0ABM3HV08_9MYRT|nr:histone-lysine N-methyltransferase, H3 lysine-9 specific SUVH6-like [Rhodamnia argentea]XP_048140434.1 histone-lysine N-methyltransferase, H3 lysine-9 specific SUVH6-like [Rhodamnia argentea]XP_048140435.1 histone-lysine N-methyltransferase, H3 lysine-9 specific SUVH6-like [Rhodamnia argentea]